MSTRVTLMMAAALAVALPAGAQTIDDFQTGGYAASIGSGDDTAVQAGSMLGGYRLTHLIVGSGAANVFARPGALDIREGQPLVVDGGYRVHPRLEIGYGFDADGQPAPLNEDLTKLGDRFVLHFEGSDRGLNVNIVVFTASGWASMGYNLDPSDAAFTRDFLFSDFTSFTAVDWKDIDHIVLVVQSGSAIGSTDWALSKIEVASE